MDMDMAYMDTGSCSSSEYVDNSQDSQHSWITWKYIFERAGITVNSSDLSELCSENVLAYCLMSNKRLRIVLNTILKDKTIVEKIVQAINSALQSGQKRRRIEDSCPSPSTLGNLTRNTQKTVNQFQIKCHRGLHGLNITLQVEEFGKFVDKIEMGHSVPSKFVDYALELMTSAAKFTNENVKAEKLTQILRKMLDEKDFTVGSKSWGSAGNAKSDISVCCGEYVLMNVECKKELCYGGAEPNLENIGYFIKFQKKIPDNRAPMVLLSVVGPYHMQVFGAAWDNESVCTDPLCSPVSLLYVPSDPTNGVLKLARVFCALVELINALKFPPAYPSEGPYYTMNGKLQDVKRVGNYTRVFEGTLDGRPVIFKFSLSKYGFSVHEHLAARQLAPIIVHHELLPGNWHVIIMEKILNSKRWERPPNTGLRASLDKVLVCLGEKKYVHGDLRPQNILPLDDDTVRVLDFDWAGTEGIARYPLEMNMQLGWHKDVKRGELLEQKHDTFLIRSLSS